MMNRMAFNNYQSMNLVHKTSQGNQLWLGDYYAASNISLLKQKNIKSVLTSAAMLGISYPKEAEINHKVINAFDIPSYKMTPHFEEAFKFIEDALSRGNILVHCAAGISRSTTFVLVYLMRAANMTFDRSMGYVRLKRSIICPNYGFQNELKRYEIALRKNFKQKSNTKEQTNNNPFDQFEEKKAVLDFINNDKKRPLKAQENKLNSTVGGNRSQISQSETKKLGNTSGNNNGFLRGQSLNYSRKPVGMYNSYDPRDNANKLTKNFLTYKLQTPKIVTIKK